jgi:hypothetical protein
MCSILLRRRDSGSAIIRLRCAPCERQEPCPTYPNVNRSPQTKSSVFKSRSGGCLPKPDTMSAFTRLRGFPVNLNMIVQHTGSCSTRPRASSPPSGKLVEQFPILLRSEKPPTAQPISNRVKYQGIIYATCRSCYQLIGSGSVEANVSAAERYHHCPEMDAIEEHRDDNEE